MLNLTRIADKHNKDDIYSKKEKPKKSLLLFVSSLPLIIALLFYGNYRTSQKKEKMLIASAKSIIENNVMKVDKLLDYSFERIWISDVEDLLDILSKTDENFPYISIVQKDSIQNIKVFLEFQSFHGNSTDSIRPLKKDYIFKSSKPERIPECCFWVEQKQYAF
ncbi:hypothetical protein [Pricia sp.]|uniref:hypothetical protein n=1 Tax=Pricia sp. TaxID=2268138 RepID=UPI003593205D